MSIPFDFSMIEQFVITEKSLMLTDKYNKITLIGESCLTKFVMIALFKSIGCEIKKISSMNYKSENRLFRGRPASTKKFKKFIVLFDKSVNVDNLMADLSTRKKKCNLV